jgi:phosphopantothenoylcysteine decarboxylase/phosphopantothenate--cysteine ligase
MSILKDKKILIGVTAGIAAYKSANLVRLFKKCGAEVKVIMTPASKDFVTPLTLSALSQNPVYSSFINEDEDKELWNNHVELGLWADYFVIAPATANTLAKMANGVCDNLLLAAYLSAKCKVYFAPAMDLDMYKHESTKASFKKLTAFGNRMIPAGTGELASGLIGEGRMAEPEDIVTFIEKDIRNDLPLTGQRIVITAGPTHEAIDPVRFIGNHSSGKMGYEIAKAAAQLGAAVTLISGPTAETISNSNVDLIRVTSAEDMYDAVHKSFKDCSVAIMSAAVADYRPKSVAVDKIKKKSDTLTITLQRTKDILKSLGEIKNSQYLVGFALETSNEIEHALEKLSSKNLDLIVLNSLRDEGAGFGGDTNKVTFITKSKEIIKHDLKSKKEVAFDLLKLITDKLHA